MYFLRRKGFETKFFNPNIILITWNYEVPNYDDDKLITLSDKNSKRITLTPNNKTNKTNQININTLIPLNNSNVFRPINDYKRSGIFMK